MLHIAAKTRFGIVETRFMTWIKNNPEKAVAWKDEMTKKHADVVFVGMQDGTELEAGLSRYESYLLERRKAREAGMVQVPVIVLPPQVIEVEPVVNEIVTVKKRGKPRKAGK